MEERPFRLLPFRGNNYGLIPAKQAPLARHDSLARFNLHVSWKVIGLHRFNAVSNLEL